MQDRLFHLEDFFMGIIARSETVRYTVQIGESVVEFKRDDNDTYISTAALSPEQQAVFSAHPGYTLEHDNEDNDAGTIEPLGIEVLRARRVEYVKNNPCPVLNEYGLPPYISEAVAARNPFSRLVASNSRLNGKASGSRIKK
jgi:hypothetical protein